MTDFSKPTKEQLEWADCECGVLIHCLIGTDTDPAVRAKFNPEKLDTDQWIRSAKELGATYAVITDKHGTGFTNHPTKANDYTVSSWAWRDGKGDIIADFIKSCKKYGIKPGLYYHLNYNDYYNIHHENAEVRKTDRYKAYVKVVEQQVEELWSSYGEVFEIWFDSGVIEPEDGGSDVVPLLKKYQPNALLMNGPHYLTNGIRWVGNENGFAPENCWGSTDNPTSDRSADAPPTPEQLRERTIGSPNGKFWRPAESDVPNRNRQASGGGWNWGPDEKKYCFTPETIRDFYLNTVGRNTNLMVGMAIAEDGSFEDEDQFIAAGNLIREARKTVLAEKENITDDLVTLEFGGEKPVGWIEIREDITDGHKALAFRVLADGCEIASSNCIGHKRIFNAQGIRASSVTVEITEKKPGMRLRDVRVFEG